MDWAPTLADKEGPVYRHIADALAADINNGRLRRGQQLPTHRALAKALGIDLLAEAMHDRESAIDAFMKTHRDAEFLEEARKLNLEISPLSGDIPLGAADSLFMFPILAFAAFFVLRGVTRRTQEIAA